MTDEIDTFTIFLWIPMSYLRTDAALSLPTKSKPIYAVNLYVFIFQSQTKTYVSERAKKRKCSIWYASRMRKKYFCPDILKSCEKYFCFECDHIIFDGFFHQIFLYI